MFKLLMIVTLIATGQTNTMVRHVFGSNQIMTFPNRELCEAQAKLDEPITVEMFQHQYGATRGKDIELDFTCEPIGKPA